MCVLLLDTLRLFHKHALLWSTLTVEIRGVSGGKAAELIWGPRGSGWEESGNPRFPHHCPFLPQRRWAEEKSVPPRMRIFTVFLKSKPFTCDFPSSVTSGNILCTSSQLGLLLVTPGPFQIVFGKSRMCWFVWAATCRGRTAFRHGWTWTSDCPQGSFSLCFSVLFLFFFTPEFASVLTFSSTNVCGSSNASAYIVLVFRTCIYSAAIHSPSAFQQIQCSKKVQGHFHQVQTCLWIAKEEERRAMTRHWTWSGRFLWCIRTLRCKIIHEFQSPNWHLDTRFLHGL